MQAYSARCNRHVHARGGCARVARGAMQMYARRDFDSRARGPRALKGTKPSKVNIKAAGIYLGIFSGMK